MKTDITSLKAVTSLTSATDPHASKIPADDPRLKLEQPRGRTLRKGPALAAALAVAGFVLIALVMALGPDRPPSPEDKAASAQSEISTRPDFVIPDSIKGAPDNSSPVNAPIPTPDPDGQPDRAKPRLGRPLPPGIGRAMVADPATDVTGIYVPPDPARQAQLEEVQRARGSGLFSDMIDPNAASGAAEGPSANGPSPYDRNASANPEANPTAASVAARLPGSRDDDQNLQGRKNDFLAGAGRNDDEYSGRIMTAPRSPFEVKAGTIIPASLITGLNTDTPGQVIGQVRENVYDTVTGNHLLIPQGSRLLATYDSMMAFGQERVLLCWNRLVRPDGSSITLECMPGTDLAGQAGVADEVDHHWGRVVGGAALASVLAVGTASSQGSVNALKPSFGQLAAGAVAGQVAQTGQDLTSRNLRIQPTVKIRPGFSVNVLVSKDLIIPPYGR